MHTAGLLFCQYPQRFTWDVHGLVYQIATANTSSDLLADRSKQGHELTLRGDDPHDSSHMVYWRSRVDNLYRQAFASDTYG